MSNISKQEINTVSGGQVAQNVSGNQVQAEQYIENQTINNNSNFIFEFEYNEELNELVNIEDFYIQLEDYFYNYRNIEYEIKTNIENKLTPILKKELRELIEKVISFDKFVSFSYIAYYFNNFEQILFRKETTNQILLNQFQLLQIFMKKYCEEENLLDLEIYDLIEEYPNIDFSFKINNKRKVVDKICNYPSLAISSLNYLLENSADYSLDNYKKQEIKNYITEWKNFDFLLNNENYYDDN